MPIGSSLSRALTVSALTAGILAMSVPGSSYADPPSWAPAHGKRKKGEDYTGYNGKKWKRDYGVLEGRCNREAVGAVIGGAIMNNNNRGGSAHVEWCYDRYRSYRAYDNTFQPNYGQRRQCNSPFG